jgi:hypothetical protein
VFEVSLEPPDSGVGDGTATDSSVPGLSDVATHLEASAAQQDSAAAEGDSAIRGGASAVPSLATHDATTPPLVTDAVPATDAAVREAGSPLPLSPGLRDASTEPARSAGDASDNSGCGACSAVGAARGSLSAVYPALAAIGLLSAARRPRFTCKRPGRPRPLCTYKNR